MELTGIGIALLLFAILLQLCSVGMELAALGIGVVGIILTFMGGRIKR